MTLREQLTQMADPRYRAFVTPLMPGVAHVIGVRLPLLRRIAREIARGAWREYLAADDDRYFEERMLRGMVIGAVRCPADEKLEYVARFVPKIDNWAVCDSFCWRLLSDERAPMWAFIRPYFRSAAEYDVRFAAVMALSNYVDAEHLDELLSLLGGVRHEGYYARMGVAWAVSVCVAKCPDRTMRWLQAACPLDDWTYNKTLRKAVESYRVPDALKRELRAMKRCSE